MFPRKFCSCSIHCCQHSHPWCRSELDQSGSHFDRGDISIEGFSRLSWGIVPFVAGGGYFEHWELYRRLTSGTNPEHPEYWHTIEYGKLINSK